jgi:hypothetical protein
MYIQVDTGYGYQPALGVTYDMLTVAMSRDGGDFEEKIVEEAGWRDLGDGYYSMLWTESDLSVLGELYWTFAVAAISFAATGAFDVDPAPLYVDPTGPTCLVTGNLVDIGGDPLTYNPIRLRPRNVPGVAGQSIIASGHITASTDANGNFSVRLLRSAIVLVEIENAGIRHIITVPDTSTANMIDLLPPIPLPIP